MEELNENGIVSGYPDGTYRPNAKSEDFSHLLFYSSGKISIGLTDYTRYIAMRDGHMQRIQ